MKETEGNIFHEIAAHKHWLRSHLSLFANDKNLDKLHEKNDDGQTPLGTAIDYENWAALRLYIKFNINDDTIIHSLGEILSHYWHHGSSILDKFIFLLILKKGYLSKTECNYLAVRALDGNAWPFVAPLLNFSDLPQSSAEQNFHWQIADVPLLKTAVAALLAEERQCRLVGRSVFLCSDTKLSINPYIMKLNEKQLSSFIFRKRRRIAREIKKSVWNNRINYKLIKRLMYLY